MAKLSTAQKRGFGLSAILLAAPLVAYFEGTVLRTYKDPVGIPTACIGETDREIVLRNTFTEQECTALLGASLQQHMTELAGCVAVPVKSHEAAALVSWSYNIGTTAACNSTLMSKLNAGSPPTVWCTEMARWIYAGGKQMQGLVNRRTAEIKMCTEGTWK